VYCISCVVQQGAGVQPGQGQVRIITASNGCHLYFVMIIYLRNMIYHFSKYEESLLKVVALIAGDDRCHFFEQCVLHMDIITLPSQSVCARDDFV
jgi:hypothetical protein